VLCGPFTPLLFMGEEWAASSPFPYFAGPRDPELDEAVRRGRVDEFTAFGWDGATVPDPVDEATLAQARLPWCAVDHGEHAAMLDWYRRLLRLRREHSELSDPRPESASLDVDEARRLLVLRRGGLAVHANLGNGDVVVEADATEVLLASSPRVDLEDGQLVLPPHSLAVIR
jgi:maltooligosyltrehalose trehalohydrolase